MHPKKRLRIDIPLWWPTLGNSWRTWLPSRGNALFTLIVIGGLIWATNVGALPLTGPSAAGPSTNTIAYQGRLASTSGTPVTAAVGMEFRLYNAPTGGQPLWTETWTGSNSVQVSDGLFNVMLGSLSAVPQSVITTNSSLWLGITVGTDGEMSPRVQLGSVPYATQALTVADSSITPNKLSLPTGTACLGSHLNLSVPANNQRVNVPGLQLNLSLTRSSKVLIWVDGLARYDQNGETYFMLHADSPEVTGGISTVANEWTLLKGQKLTTLAAGSHSIYLEVHSLVAGTAFINGGISGDNIGFRTCINYLVIG